jgi:AcrR family transcriptional regulator
MLGRRKGTENQKEALLQAALRLLKSGADPEALTLRAIGEEAGVAHGLITYYFGSKDGVLAAAVGSVMREEASRAFEMEGEPRELIKLAVMRDFKIGARWEPVMRYAVRLDHQGGSWGLVRSLLPVLRRCYGGRRTELQLVAMAAQIAAPIQAFYLNPEPFEELLGIPRDDPGLQERLLETLIDGALAGAEGS